MASFVRSFKGLLNLGRRSAAGIVLSGMIMLLEVACSLAFVFFSKRVVDIATGVSSEPLSNAIIFLVCVMAVQVICRIASGYVEGIITINAKNKIRSRIFAHAMRSTWSGQNRFHSADIVNRLEEDIRVITDFLCGVLPSVFVIVAQGVAACIFLFALSPSLGWVLIFIMPVAVIASRLFFRKQRELTSAIRGIDSRIQGHMQEHLQHRVVDMTIGSTGSVEDTLNSMQDNERTTTLVKLRYSALSRGFMQVGFASGYLLAFLWGVFGLKDGSITYGVMVAFLQLVGQVQRPVSQLASCIPSFIRAIASEERLEELLDMELENDAPDVLLSDVPGIELTSLNFSYTDGTPVIQNLSYNFLPGSFTSIVGPTGVGKSTLIRLVLGLVEPTSGSVEIYSGKKKLPCAKNTRCNFMYVPQGNTLLSGTIRQNLLLANPSATEEQITRALQSACADFVLSLPSGLDTVVAEVGGGLSEGQAQRIAIARALLRQGGVLILDEATSALDPATEQQVLDNIKNSYKGTKTVLCITHRSAATLLSDAILSL